PVLGERVTALGWLGAALGFLGVLLIIRPSGGLDSFGVAMALINAVCATLYHLSTRYLAKIERPATLMIYTLLVGAVTFTLLAFDDLFKYAPTLQEWAMMAGLGVVATLGHFLITLSYREAPASLLAPVNYVHILFSALAAWIVFDHAPDVLTSIGMLCIAVAGAGIALYSHFTKLASRA
ncbi:MAG: DMT family transporter, partial [Rhodobacteraceae bacterium]|nr:DMT family transporter [Paracoccaceae bacterium]